MTLTREELIVQPPERFVNTAIEMAMCSPCQSKRGVAIFRENLRIASGYNFKPRGFDCDGSDACKATCRNEAIHAEQMALLKGGLHVQGCDLLHVKAVGGQLVPSGGPSCVQCSKLIRASGIDGVWLYHADGWRRYDSAEFHQLSLAALASSPSEEQEHDGFGLTNPAQRGPYGTYYWVCCEPLWAIRNGRPCRQCGQHATSSAPSASGLRAWEPIETAPKDGTHILAIRSAEGFSNHPDCIAWNLWVGEWANHPAPPDFPGQPLQIVKHQPTHWMPLPDPPREGRSPAGETDQQ